MSPQRAADAAGAGAAGALLPPRLLATPRDLTAALGLVRATPPAGQVLPHRFPHQTLIRLGGKDLVREFQLLHLLAFEIFHLKSSHVLFSLLLSAYILFTWCLRPSHHKVSALGARHGPFHDQSILFRQHLNHFQVAHGDSRVAHMAGGAHSLQNAGGER
jgi:hypothetical protein